MAKKVEKPKTKAVTRHTVTNGTPEAMTVLRIQEVAKMVSEGKTRDAIIDHLCGKYGIAYDTARNYYTDGIRWMIPKDEDEYRKEIIYKNFNRLETIIERAMSNNQLKIAREAIDSLNKMVGIGNGGFQVAVNNDKENNTQQIYIKFD